MSPENTASMLPAVAAFTDTYQPTVNGVTYTVSTWRDRWVERGGRMDIVYPAAGHDPDDGEYPVWSKSFPFYEGYHVAVPRVPKVVRDVDLVHTHTPFGLGVAGLRLARKEDIPLVANYHTPTGEYAEYISPRGMAGIVRGSASRWERWFLDRADIIVTPSQQTANYVRDTLGVGNGVAVIPNGVDIRKFRPTHPGAFLRRHDLPDDRPLVGYTGRQGYEKRLSDLIEACEGMDVTLVFGGDGPAHDDLEKIAEERGVDARFLGFLDRDELAEFYCALDVFAFPSPVETQGLVALESMACGTPVVAANAGALRDTIEEGVTGYHYEPENVDEFRETLERGLADSSDLSTACLEKRDEFSVERAIDELSDLYEELLESSDS